MSFSYKILQCIFSFVCVMGKSTNSIIFIITYLAVVYVFFKTFSCICHTLKLYDIIKSKFTVTSTVSQVPTWFYKTTWVRQYAWVRQNYNISWVFIHCCLLPSHCTPIQYNIVRYIWSAANRNSTVTCTCAVKNWFVAYVRRSRWEFFLWNLMYINAIVIDTSINNTLILFPL